MTTAYRAGSRRSNSAISIVALFTLLALSACGSSTTPANSNGSSSGSGTPPPASSLHCAPEPVLGAAATTGVAANPQLACAAQPEPRRS